MLVVGGGDTHVLTPPLSRDGGAMVSTKISDSSEETWAAVEGCLLMMIIYDNAGYSTVGG